MRNGLVIADSGPVFSLAVIDRLDINCVGNIGILKKAKEKGLTLQLKPLFEKLIQNKRFYSLELLNSVLLMKGETIITTTK